MQWTFENYRLDGDNAALWKNGEQVALRPKTFDVLRYLVEHAGELVRKETLLETVWENTYVVEGVLTTSMSELRKLFGDTAKNQRFIATVYRRGYRFIAEVEADAGESAPLDEAPPQKPQSEIPYRFPRMRGFVGRKQESERLLGLLAHDPECRILTLVGPGGIGKTRLALNVAKLASELEQPVFAHGIFAVALQSLDATDDLHGAIADALELQYSGESSQQRHILNAVAGKQMLLVLDNFEHLMSQAAALVDLIEAAPGVKILLTSRESLPVSEAWFHPVSGLEYSDALRLFAQVARRNQPEFDVTVSMPLVLRICEMVEGMPLALELAASWLKMLSMQEVAEEIEKGIDILSDQDGGHDDRHRSVRAIFLETWQHLNDDERGLLMQFSLFRGGAVRDAISEVIGAGLPLLVNLVNKALLRTTRQSRYRMHELIRQFAEQELARDSDAEQQARERHAQYYLAWLGAHLEGLRGQDQGRICAAIQADIDNIKSAWRWAVAQHRIDLLHQAIRSLSLFTDMHGLFHVGLAMFAQARDLIAASDHAEREALVAQLDLRSAILNFRLSRYPLALEQLRSVLETGPSDYERALCLRYLGDYEFSHAGYCSAEQARSYLDECIALCAQIGETHLHTACLSELAILHANLDMDIDASQRYAAQAVELARPLERADLLATALDVLAWTTNHRGDYAAAESIWREVFDIAQRSGNLSQQALATNWLGWSAWSLGGERHAEATQLFSDALLRYRNLGDRANQAMTCADLASVQLETGDLAAAAENCRRGLDLAREIGREDHYVYNLYTLGAVACAQGDLDAARDKLAEALSLAWAQEEETNKPVVLYYVAQLLLAEYRHQAQAEKLQGVFRLLLFLQAYPPTWQTFRDRARRLQAQIVEETGIEPAASLVALPAADLVESVLADIPELLTRPG